MSIARSATNPPKVALFHICKIINFINLTPDESQEDEAAADFSWSLHLAPVKDTFHKPVLCCNSWHIATHLALCNKVLNQGGSYHHNTAPSLNSDLLSNFTIFPINYHHGRTEAKKSLWLRVIKFSSIYPASTYVNVKKTVPDLDCFISKPKPKQIWLQKCTDYLYEQQFNCERVSSSNVRLPRHRKRSLRMTASIYTGYSSRPCVPSSSV